MLITLILKGYIQEINVTYIFKGAFFLLEWNPYLRDHPTSVANAGRFMELLFMARRPAVILVAVCYSLESTDLKNQSFQKLFQFSQTKSSQSSFRCVWLGDFFLTFVIVKIVVLKLFKKVNAAHCWVGTFKMMKRGIFFSG